MSDDAVGQAWGWLTDESEATEHAGILPWGSRGAWYLGGFSARPQQLQHLVKLAFDQGGKTSRDLAGGSLVGGLGKEREQAQRCRDLPLPGHRLPPCGVLLQTSAVEFVVRHVQRDPALGDGELDLIAVTDQPDGCLLYTSPSPRD